MNNEIRKLAKECIHDNWNDADWFSVSPERLEAFYRAAYNKAIEDSAKVADECGEHNCACFHNIRTLEMK